MSIALSSTSLTATVADPTHFLLHDLDLVALTRRLRSTYPTLDVDMLVSEYRRFLLLKYASRDEHATLVSPSPMIDQVWHEHILETRSYIGMCLTIGFWIHHDPDGADDKDTIDRERRRANTNDMYMAMFGPMDQSVWDMEGFNMPFLPGIDPFASSAAVAREMSPKEDESAEWLLSVVE